MQQCATTALLHADANQDVTLTSRENLAGGNSLRPPDVPGTRTISGVVFEMSDAGRQPIEGATVGFESDLDFVSAWTFTDANGRYLLCGLPETRLALFVKRTPSSSVSYPTIEAGSDAVLDVEVTR